MNCIIFWMDGEVVAWLWLTQYHLYTKFHSDNFAIITSMHCVFTMRFGVTDGGRHIFTIFPSQNYAEKGPEIPFNNRKKYCSQMHSTFPHSIFILAQYWKAIGYIGIGICLGINIGSILVSHWQLLALALHWQKILVRYWFSIGNLALVKSWQEILE